MAFPVLTRRSVLAAALFSMPAAIVPARAEIAEGFPIPVELRLEIDEFPGRIEQGAPKGDVTIVEFIDYNCPICRTQTGPLERFVAEDGAIRLVTVVWPVLSFDSVDAARVAAAARRQLAKPRWLALHHSLLTVRGKMDGARARKLAIAAGADGARLDRDIANPAVGKEIVAAVSLGDRLGFNATPAYIVHGEAHIGVLPLDDVKAMVAAVRRCDRTRC